MSQYFFDTSAIVKYYHSEAGTQAVSDIFTERGRKIRISSLGLLEIQSAIAMKVRSGGLTREAARTRFSSAALRRKAAFLHLLGGQAVERRAGGFEERKINIDLATMVDFMFDHRPQPFPNLDRCAVSGAAGPRVREWK